ncbi:MAG: hypothetical protein ACR2L6_11570 [Gemmatimonadaceae bacterium]
MLHLPAERLIELGESEPTNTELAHLGVCAECERERRAYRALRGLAIAEGATAGAPLTSWDVLSAALKDEGLLVRKPAPVLALTPPGTPAVMRPRRRWQASDWTLRAAAGLLFLVGGMAIGKSSTLAPFPTAAKTSSERQPASATTTDAPVGLASNFSVSYTSNAEALAALYRAQREYERAATFLMTNNPVGDETQPDVYRARLAALDNVMQASMTALEDAPADPVINRYYIAAAGARESTLRQLQTSLPPGSRIDSF